MNSFIDNVNFTNINNSDSRNSDINSSDKPRGGMCYDNVNNNEKNKSQEKNNNVNNYSSNNNRTTKRNCRSKHYEEVNKCENFIEFINFKIENFQKEMMDYLNTVKIDLDKAYKKFYEKVLKISTDKARRISQVYNTSSSKAGLLSNLLSNSNDIQMQNNNDNNSSSSFVAFTKQTSAENLNFSESHSLMKTGGSNLFNTNPTNNNINIDNDNEKQKDFLPLITSHSEKFNLHTSPLNPVNTLNERDNKNTANDFLNFPNNKSLSFNYNNSKLDFINNNQTQQEKIQSGAGSGAEASSDQTRYLSKELENLKSFANKYITERIDTMFVLHENLKDSIKQNFSLLTSFLNDYDFNCLNPMQEFINANADEICNSWVLPKMKFEKLNLNCILKNNKIPKTFRNYLINEDSENKFNKYTIEKSASYELDKRILKQNSLYLEKLVLQKLNSVSELQKVFESQEIQILNFDKMKKLKFSKSSLDYLANLNGFKNVCKLEAKKSFFYCEIPQDLCEKNFSNLTKICFRRCNLDNASLGILMSEFEKLKNLEEINFANNAITLFNYRGYAAFNSLHTLILRKNKISKFYLKNKNMYPKLKVVDLCSNNIVELTQVKELVEENSVMVLISRNLGLNNCIEAYKAYLLSLKSIMLQAENKLRKMDLSYLYYSFSNRESFHFKNLCLNKILLFNIKKLDLSFNNLSDEDLAEFFKNNRGFVNIKQLSLRNNRITESLFQTLIDLELNDLYEYLEMIDLANNCVDHKCLEALLKAFKDNSNLKLIVLKNNPVEKYFYSFLCRRLINKERNERFQMFFNSLERLRLEKRSCTIVLNYNSDYFKFFTNEAKEISSRFIKFEK